MQHAPSAPPAAARAFAWTGALLFALSLGYFIYAYAVTFGRPVTSGATARAVTWNVALFTLFAIHHSVFARLTVRQWVVRNLPAGLERSLYVWIASLLFLGVVALWQPVPGIAWRAEGAAVWGLRVLQGFGLWLTLRGAAVLDVFELAGVRGASEAGGDEFRTSGPYGWVRHPIYAGWFLLVFAASPMTMTRLVFAVVSGLYLILAIPLEERSMRATAPGAYERYISQVKWRIVPGLYALFLFLDVLRQPF